MGATTRCRACGGTIQIGEGGIESGAFAIGDNFFHRGCVEGAPGDDSAPTVPRYYLPGSG